MVCGVARREKPLSSAIKIGPKIFTTPIPSLKDVKLGVLDGLESTSALCVKDAKTDKQNNTIKDVIIKFSFFIIPIL